MIDSRGVWVSVGAWGRGEGPAGSVLLEPFPRAGSLRRWTPTWRPSPPHPDVAADDLLKAHPEIAPPAGGDRPGHHRHRAPHPDGHRTAAGHRHRKTLPALRPQAPDHHVPPTSSAGPATTSACAPWPAPSGGWRPRWPRPPASTPTTCTWLTPPPSSAPAPGPPCDARTWPAGPATGTAPRTHASSGTCACT
mgnify:CR=1 FL=1